MTLDSDTTGLKLDAHPELNGRFDILNLLGDGAAGLVYRARDKTRSNREVALKVLANDLAFDEATLDRFIAELKLCQHLRHPNVVEAYDLIELDDTVAYTMEYVDGGSLQSIFVEQRIGYPAIDRIMEQVLDGVHALHERGIIHRDIKLENILVRTDGVVKITDLGLMKQIGKKGLTKPGILLGTPQYMPPEYVYESCYDERGDIYTLGLLLYEMLTGKRFLSHLKGQEAITYLMKTKFHVSQSALSGIPRKYLAVLTRALDPRPDNRFQSALEMKELLLAKFEQEAEAHREITGGLVLQKYATQTSATPSRFSFLTTMWFKIACGIVAGLGISLKLFYPH